MWLLSYGARYKRWLPSYGVKDHISGHSLFNHLRAKQVSHYCIALIGPAANSGAACLHRRFNSSHRDIGELLAERDIPSNLGVHLVRG